MNNSALSKLNPFELSIYFHNLINRKKTILDAGRGNPNWTAPTPRLAFFLLGEFAVKESIHHKNNALGGQVKVDSERLKRFREFIETRNNAGTRFWKEILNLDDEILGMQSENFVSKACDAIIGDNYPSPVKCIDVCRSPLKTFFKKKIFKKDNLDFDVFPTEGGAAGICYIFHTLMKTKMLERGDKIALFLPTFAPYVEIPRLPDYDFKIVPIRASKKKIQNHIEYYYPDSELEKLLDKDIKVGFIVNPSNPNSNALNFENLKEIRNIINDSRPDLIMITDDVYGTFVPNFSSLFAVIPKNTICLYSFSKYYGATGWRLGCLVVAQDNVMNEKIKRLPSHLRTMVAQRYSSISPNINSLSFIDYLVADSRDVALNHVAGLSTPQQLMMSLFSLYSLLKNGEIYQNQIINVCHKRENELFKVLELPNVDAKLDTAYYCDFNILDWVKLRWGEKFAIYFESRYTPIEYLVKLAEQ